MKMRMSCQTLVLDCLLPAVPWPLSTPAVCNVLSRSGKTLATGVWEGVSGIVLSPVIGAKNDGVVGFCTGVGKGVLGAFVKPVSAVLDVTHLTIQGALLWIAAPKIVTLHSLTVVNFALTCTPPTRWALSIAL